jgi:tRNA uridine 5-carboxymethylaminomethyl modification enzyme
MTRFSHPHPAPAPDGQRDFDLLVVGGGHAGIEAALAGARLGVSVGLLTLDLERVGEMSCNPAIGGLGKGQIVREIDALGGAMGQVADATGIQFRILNTGKGAAVQAPRCQSDRHRYRREVTAVVRAQPGLELVAGAALGLLLTRAEDGREWVVGVRTEAGQEIRAGATILTTGTFMGALMHTGEETEPGGRVGERSVGGLTESLSALGLRLGRLKTGTPPRLDATTLNYERMEEQLGDDSPRPFSFTATGADFPALPQVPCHITYTTGITHQIIADNIHRAPMYAGRIQGVGPRYCPSVEDKIMRFPDRDRHQIFVEPEGLDTTVAYINGISTSLPAEVQEAFVRTIPGLEEARFERFGYAVEYDFIQPSQLSYTLALRQVPGLFLAGQLNGTSGYEEAAGQGLWAGANAALWLQGREPFVLGRHEAYLGVMVDDLILTNPSEPYRMFSSRAEYRLLLRSDNADRRLTPRAAAIGLVGAERGQDVQAKDERVHQVLALLERERKGGRTLAEILRRPGTALADLASQHPDLAALARYPDLARTIEVEVKYAGYLQRQEDNVRRAARQENVSIPDDLDYSLLQGLGGEARERLSQIRPSTLGAAGRIEGVRPPDVALLGVYVARHRRQHSATGTRMDNQGRNVAAGPISPPHTPPVG